MTARGWILFAAVSVVWGVPYLFIKLAVEDMSPGFMAWARVALAALVLLPVAWRSGALRGLPLRWLTAFALVEITIPFPLIAFGEQRVSSSLAAILIAAVPLVVAFLALRFDRAEQPSRTRFVGMLIGLAGVVALVGIDIGGRGSELVGAAAILTATFGYACGPLIAKRHLTAGDPLGPVAAALGIASMMLLPLAIGGFPTEPPTAQATASIVVLGLVCTAFGFLIFFRLIAEVGPSRATHHHLREPDRRAGPRGGDPGRERHRRRDRRAAADPGGLVAVDGRPPAARTGGRRGRAGAAVGARGPAHAPLAEPDRAGRRRQPTSGGDICSTSPLTRSKIARARSRWSRSCVAITDVRSSAPPRCTAG